ncbi:MAG: bacteriohemerythrin [Candidatus Melainabacteria bacterium]|nr:bacteriohemerythrin [Candidatus Melainabacteria bacterium]
MKQKEREIPGTYEPLQWESKYSVREQFLDTHHQSLLALVNLLRSMCQDTIKKELVLATLADLKEYCNYHFIAEEKYMAINHYTGLEEHRESHELYTRTITSFYQEIETGKLDKIFDLVDFLEQWWEHHILVLDQDYADFIEARA